MSVEREHDEVLDALAGLLEEDRVHGSSVSGAEGVPLANREEIESVLEAILIAPDPVEPPRRVRERLMQRVRSGEPRAPRVALAALAAGLTAAVVAAGGAWWLAEQRLVDPLREAQQVLQTRVDELVAANDELQSMVDEQDDELGEFEDALANAQEHIRMLRHPGLEVVTLGGTGDLSGASARVFWEWDDYTCYLHAMGLKPPDAGDTYALWLDTEKRGTILVDRFEPDGRGEAVVFQKLPRDAGHVLRAWVTEEPTDVDRVPHGRTVMEARERT
jgi:hypothetical protein